MVDPVPQVPDLSIPLRGLRRSTCLPASAGAPKHDKTMAQYRGGGPVMNGEGYYQHAGRVSAVNSFGPAGPAVNSFAPTSARESGNAFLRGDGSTQGGSSSGGGGRSSVLRGDTGDHGVGNSRAVGARMGASSQGQGSRSYPDVAVARQCEREGCSVQPSYGKVWKKVRSG